MDDEATRKRREEAAETLTRELKHILLSGIMTLQPGRDVIQNIRFADFEFQVTWHGTPYFGDRLFERVSLTIDWNNRAPPARTEDDDAPSGAKARAAADAIAALGPLDGLMAKERHARYQEWCRATDRPVPSVRILQEVESAR